MGKLENLYSAPPVIRDEDPFSLATDEWNSHATEYAWLALHFLGMAGPFVCHGPLPEHAAPDGKHPHEPSPLLVTRHKPTVHRHRERGRYARAEKPSTIPPA